jgi:hypothetical protein
VRKFLVANGYVAAFAILTALGLIGWAVLMVIAFSALLGLIILAAELARPHFIKGTVPHDEEEVRSAREERRAPRGDFSDCTDFG